MGYDIPADHHGPLPSAQPAERRREPTAAPETWTTADQIALEKLQARRERVLTEQRKPVIEVSQLLVEDMPRQPLPADVADVLIQHAERVIDALKPYDSNTRAEKAS